MSENATAARTLVRLTVQSEGRRLDATVPSLVPLVEIIPGFTRSLGILDPTLTSGGYALQRADGTVLDPAQNAATQELSDGDILTLVRGDLVAAPRVYDDIVEAVLDATGEQRQWTVRDNTRTALAISLSFVALCGVLLVSAGRGQLLGLIIAIAGALLLLSTAAFTARLGEREAGSGLGVAAAAYGALAGYLAIPADLVVWGWPLAAAAGAAIVVGGAGLAVSPNRPAVQFVPVVAGAAVVIPAITSGLNPPSTFAAYTLMLAVAGVLANALPWLALSTTQLRVISAQSDAEIFANVGAIDTPEVLKRAAAGHRTLTALRCALGIALLVATPLAASQNGWGVLLCALTFVGMMFPARMSFARAHVIVLLTLGTVGLILTTLTAALTQPQLIPIMLIVLVAAAAITIVVAVLDPRARTRLAWMADGAEVTVLSALLPIALIAGNLV